MMSAIRFFALATSLVAFLAPSQAVAQLNLAGRWHVGAAGIDFLQVEQSGAALSVTVSFPGVGDLVFTGTAADPFELDCGADPDCPPPNTFLVGRPNPGNTALLASLYASFGELPFYATRCECDDGNVADGDGCAADCRVEACFACVGDPSTCTPVGDGQACEDGMDCTAGETCTAGVCGGGSAVSPPCIDMTGTWNVRTHVEDFDADLDAVWEVVQRGGNLVVRDEAGTVRDMGTIDALSGDVELVGGPVDLNGFAFCASAFLQPSTLVVDAAGDTLSGATSVVATTPTQCVAFPATVSGARSGVASCGDGVLTPPEQCDDGNHAAGDCCDPSCMYEAEGSRCDQACGVCSAGACAPGALPAQACVECDTSAGCKAARLLLRDSADDAGDTFVWKWPGAAAIAPASVAVPGTAGYEVCVYDLAAPAPTFLVAARVGDDASCRGGSCWKQLGNPPGSKGLRFHDRQFTPAGIAKLDLRPGASGAAKIAVRGHGAGLAVDGQLPLSASFALRAEIRAPDGSCWRSTFDAADARRNEAGFFKARSD